MAALLIQSIMQKGLINIENIDENECFKWRLVKYLNLSDQHPAKIREADKDLSKNLDFEDVECPVKISDIHKIGKKNSTDINFFGYQNKENIQFMYQNIYVKKKMLNNY